MLKSLPVRPRQVQKSQFSFAIVASQYNEQFVQPMVSHASQELKVLEPGAPIASILAPGAFEIPLLVQTAAELNRYSAILALGVIFQGQTAHAQLIAQGVSSTLLSLSLKHRVPIIHEVLLLESEEQAHARCIESSTNRGTEAARAAVFAARALLEIK